VDARRDGRGVTMSSTPPQLLLQLALLLLASLPWQVAAATQQAPPPPPHPECISLLGVPLYRPTFTGLLNTSLETNLAIAEDNVRLEPRSVTAQVWLARRQGYLWRFNQSIATCLEAAAPPPPPAPPTAAAASEQLRATALRFAGHHQISTRQIGAAAQTLDEAWAALQSAQSLGGPRDVFEADGEPNAHNLPSSTLASNIQYHRGLAKYLDATSSAAPPAGFDAAQAAWRSGLYDYSKQLPPPG
jgi:hypothetical protein